MSQDEVELYYKSQDEIAAAQRKFDWLKYDRREEVSNTSDRISSVCLLDFDGAAVDNIKGFEPEDDRLLVSVA
jgi:hypothetical protein